MKVLSSLVFVIFFFGCSQKGEKGSQGEKGSAGDIRMPNVGSGEPSLGNYNEGDIYIDADSGDIYEVKDGNWLKRGSIKGEKGDVGETGSIGSTGSQGEKGGVGDQGPTGEQGKKGDIGYIGPQGDTGPQGPLPHVDYKIKCKTTIPNLNTVIVEYELVSFSNNTIFVKSVMYDDDTQFGSSFDIYFHLEDEYEFGETKVYRDKQLNDDWSIWTFSVNKDTRDFIISYIDPVDGDESYLLSSLCSKTFFAFGLK